jgi:hypothetical protein
LIHENVRLTSATRLPIVNLGWRLPPASSGTMRNQADSTLHRRQWLRAILALYLLCTLGLAAVHQHHDNLHGHDCALCTVAHAPTTVAAHVPQMSPPTTTRCVLPIPESRIWDSEPRNTLRGRAPPLA